ncbi:MAG: SusC/RagA family TonB-linked outer membrane protein [Bacteroidales bacterium]|nr:SusC/RagA family TonB-linked outer membrane protein [Bacteroidales bacterium]
MKKIHSWRKGCIDPFIPKKLLQIMKLTILFTCLFTVNLMASVYSQNTKFNLEIRDQSIRDVLKTIEKQSKFRFFYNDDFNDLDKKIIVTAENATIEDLLSEVLSTTNIGYIVMENNFVVLTPEKNLQQLKVTGVVTDASTGEPLPGVYVRIEGTNAGAVTDAVGRYTVEIPATDAILVFSFVGYNSETITVNGKNEIDITLVPEIAELDEVVVIGYGVQKKSNITGAISQVKSDDINNSSSTDLGSALQGKVSGVQVINNSGRPGASATIRVRGYSSNGSSDPLYVVDGLKVSSIDYLSTENIESIEVLKDAASAAIYGAEAGNGVILITTKTGKKGLGKVFFNTQILFTSLADKADLLNANEFSNYLLEAYPARETELDNYYFNDPSAIVDGKLADTDWQDVFYDKGKRQNYNIGFQGGNDRASLFVSLDYTDHDGIITGPSDTYKRINGQLNASYKLKDWIEVGVTNSIDETKTKQVSENGLWYGSTLSQISILDPLTPVEYENGGAPIWVQSAISNGYSPGINPKTGNYYGVSYWASGENPITTLQTDKPYTKLFRIHGTLYTNITPVKNLVYTSRLGYVLQNNYTNRYTKPVWNSTDDTEVDPYLGVNQSGSNYYQWENFVNYTLSLNKNTFSALAGMSFIHSETNLMSVTTNDLEKYEDNYLYLDYSTTAANDLIGGNTSERAQIAYYGRLSWNYADKYNVQFNFRADAYDAGYLDLENKWGYFPSVSAGWTLSNESFMQNFLTNVLSYAKIRASYGKNGSISNLAGGYYYAATLNAGANALGTSSYNYYMNDALYTGIYPSSNLANPKLRWEESVQTDIGLDLRFFKNKLAFTGDYYNKKTDGQLVLSTATLSTGSSYVYKNVGLIRNTGFEFELEWKDKLLDDFQYGIKGNIATVINIVEKYMGEDARIGGTTLAGGAEYLTFFEEGEPVWYLRGYELEGVDPSNGQPIYKDVSGDGSITADDKTNIGNGIPEFTYGTTVTFSYKNFDFLLFGAGAYGAELFYGLTRLTSTLQNRPQFLYDNRWTPENTDATLPSAFYQGEVQFANSDAFVFDASYFKIKTIQLGYNIPESLLNRFKVSSLRAYISLEDFFTFTKYPGIDPEVRPQIPQSMAIDFGGYPLAKSILLGLNLSF